MEEKYQLEADTNTEESWKLWSHQGKGGKHLERETWWCNEEVQESLRKKKDAFEKWHKQCVNELRETYKVMKKGQKL